MVWLYFCLQLTSGLPLFYLSGYLYYYLYVNLIYSDIISTPSFVKGLINILSIGYVYTDEIDDNYKFSTLHS